jgi:hemoglobin
VVRILEGNLRLTFVDPPGVLTLSPGKPGLLLPDQSHFVEPVGSVRMQVEFYDQLPDMTAG